MATLAAIRGLLNGEIGVDTDGETSPWSQAVRNAAISDAYADLWRVGVRKDAKQDLTSSSSSWTYPLTSIRQLTRLEIVNSAGTVVERPPLGIIELDGTGANAFQLTLKSPVGTGYTLRVRGFAPYVSVFANDAAVDDLPAEHARIPRLKAKAILYQQQLARFQRYGEREAVPPDMTATFDQLLAGKREAEAEYVLAARLLSGLRPRATQTAHL